MEQTKLEVDTRSCKKLRFGDIIICNEGSDGTCFPRRHGHDTLEVAE